MAHPFDKLIYIPTKQGVPMQHIAPLNKIPRRTKAYGRLWAIKFTAQNPNWRDGESYEDAWHSFGDFDLNIYCEDGYLSVCAYPMYKDEDGDTCTDFAEFEYLVRKGKTL
jgi:hypothetical protein